MDTERRVRLVRTTAAVVVVMTFALMVVGSWVKATGSGLACPDWPTCYGEWLPPFPSADTDATYQGEPVVYSHAQVMYEWFHRALAAALGVPLLFMAYLAWTGRDLDPVLRLSVASTLLVLLVQVLLGRGTVLGKNAPALTTAHLATAAVILILVTLTAALAFLRPLASDGRSARTLFPGEDHV